MTTLERINRTRRLLGLRPLVASGDNYVEWEHPRDHNGRWIDKLSRVRLLAEGWKGLSGVIDGLRPDGVSVRVTKAGPDGDASLVGRRVLVNAGDLEAIQAKAVLPDEAEAEAAKHPAKRPWAPERPAITGRLAAEMSGKSWQDLRNRLRSGDVVVFDLETTGLDMAFDDRPTQIGGVRLRDGVVVDRFNTLVNPGRPVPEFITRLTGHSDETLADAPDVDSAYAMFLEWAGTDPDVPLVAYNATFDLTNLREMLPDDASVVDPLTIARATMPTARKGGDVENHKLTTLSDYFGVRHEGAHTADADSAATAEVLDKLLARAAASGDGASALKKLPAKNAEFESAWAAYYAEYDAWYEGQGILEKFKKSGSNVEVRGRNNDIPLQGERVVGRRNTIDDRPGERELVELEPGSPSDVEVRARYTLTDTYTAIQYNDSRDEGAEDSDYDGLVLKALVNGKWQAFYTTRWRKMADDKKFNNGGVKVIARNYDRILGTFEADAFGDGKDRDTARAIMLQALTGLRVGSDIRRGSDPDQNVYGAHSLEARHVEADGDTISFSFMAKGNSFELDENGEKRLGPDGKPIKVKGSPYNVSVTDARLARLVAEAKEGKSGNDRLFDTTSGKVNDYIARALGSAGIEGKATAHNFRHAFATTLAARLVAQMGPAETEAEFAELKRKIAEIVAGSISDSTKVALESYIDPAVWARLAGGNPGWT